MNVIGTHIVTQAFLPLLGADKHLQGPPGRIVQITSTSACVFTPLQGAYNASKAAHEAMCHVLRRELLLYGIKVIIVAPGAVKTGIWARAVADLQAQHSSADDDFRPVMQKALPWLDAWRKRCVEPEQVAKAILAAMTSRRPRYKYVVVAAWLQDWAMPVLLQAVGLARVLDWLIAWAFGIKQQR